MNLKKYQSGYTKVQSNRRKQLIRNHKFTTGRKLKVLAVSVILILVTGATNARETRHQGSDAALQAQNAALEKTRTAKDLVRNHPAI